MQRDDEQPSSSNYKDDDGEITCPLVQQGAGYVSRNIVLHSIGKSLSLCSPYEERDLTRKCHSVKSPGLLPTKCQRRHCFSESVLPSQIVRDERKLRSAASFNDTDTVSRLLDKGVNPNCGDSHKRTPLHLASCKGYTDVVKLLLDHGANPNIQDSLGNIPLHLAACTDHIGVINSLLKAGASAHSLDKMGRSPLQLAQSKLEILKRSHKSEAELKHQVDQIIQMLLLSSKNENLQHHILSRCNEVVQKCLSRAEIDAELNNLQDSLSNWTIK